MYFFGNSIVIVWHTEDIINRAKEQNIELTENQAKSVLLAITQKEDCNQGVNWHAIDEEIAEIIEEGPHSKPFLKKAENKVEALLSEILGDYVITSSGIGRPSKELSDTFKSIEENLSKENLNE